MARRRPPCKRPQAPRPGLEVLEDRTLLSASNILDLSGLHVNTSACSQTDILVRFQTLAGATPTAALAGTTLGPSLDPSLGMYQVNLSPGVSVGQALAAYKADPKVLDAEPDYLLSNSSVGTVPNDPLFSQQWDMQSVGAPQAWSVTPGNPRVIVGVMDTGIDYNQSDLYLNIWINQAEIPKSRLQNLLDVDHDGIISFRDLNNPINQGLGKITDVNGDGRIDAGDILAPMALDSQGRDTGKGGWAYAGNTQDGDTAHPNDFIGWNFVSNTNNPLDQNGHGTHVSGTIAATGNNGTGIAGEDWNVQLMPVQFLSASGNGSIGNFISALNYSVAHGAKITNNSWEGAGNNGFLEAAIANAQNHGQIFVAAAGNEGSNNDTNPAYPSGFPLNNIVAVAASDQNNHLAGFSNYGAHSVDLAAPGVNILSTLPGNNYGTLSGTSMATPHVTGALALVWGEHPTWTYTQVINQVLNTVTKLSSLAGKTVSGGVLNLAAAVGFAPWPTVAEVTPKVVGSSVSGPEYNTANDVRLTFNEAIDPATFTPAAVTLTGPSGQAIPLGVTPVAGSGNTQFDVTFATQTAGGTYTLVLGTAVKDTAGNPLGQPYRTTFALSPSYTFSSTKITKVPAGNSLALSTLSVNQNVTIGKVLVQLNINYPTDGTLYIHLQAPNGANIVLSNQRGGSGANFQNTQFDAEAAVPIASGQAPFTGSYRPDGSLAGLNGLNAAGTWKLWIEDRGGASSGTLTGWSLTFIPQGGGPVQTSEVAGSASSAEGEGSPAIADSAGAPAAATVADASAPLSGTLSSRTLGVFFASPTSIVSNPPAPEPDAPQPAPSRPALSTAADGGFGSGTVLGRLRSGWAFDSDSDSSQPPEDDAAETST